MFCRHRPFDITTYLNVSLTVSNQATIPFNSVSNRTSTVQYTDGLTPPLWQKLGDVLARTNNRPEVLFDPVASTNRFYRVLIPLQP
jgi:hypothetical protein